MAEDKGKKKKERKQKREQQKYGVLPGEERAGMAPFAAGRKGKRKGKRGGKRE